MSTETSARRPFTLGFHTRIPFTPGRQAEGLREGIELFRIAEQLGFDSGWVYQRHFDNYLASPLVFHAAVAQHTERIGLGTAIIGIRYEDPVLLAEAAGTADLLTGGRLQLGLGTGQGGYGRLFGQQPNDGREQSQARLATFLRGIRGEVLDTIDDVDAPIAFGTELTAGPVSPGLPERVWFGGGSVESAERVGRQGLRLLLSTILTGTIDDYNAEQLRAIEVYRRVHTGPFEPQVSVSRSFLPAASAEQARAYAAYDEERRTLGPGAARPAGALTPASSGAGRFSVSPVIHGDPSFVVDTLLADQAVQQADNLIAFLPPSFGLAENIALLEAIVEKVGPQIGWAPAKN
ncbi:LLM class flavin-dependent oxidoreductase [Subtercola endophyticus]|uniref:LLM class flavin-dependent oxidoreductase n=1 Tax=Subtercola endophyticus TaxID=2895559 RepID=UPI001E607A83|nr:LLM class flavin-dependent oxidoreductase [Subtercola endophyticus]UFS59134.1 LLM class flavin-dependent oxidoreductase [Subtercola endophyticus]